MDAKAELRRAEAERSMAFCEEALAAISWAPGNPRRPQSLERELEAATGRTTLNAAAKKLMRANAELKRLKAEAPA